VVSTRVGYTGGDAPAPTYGSVCGGDGHTEAISIEFDPNVVTYDELLDRFWEEHNPSGYKPKAQYKSAIWPTTDAQLEIARASVEKIRSKYGDVHTDVEPAKEWHDAEVSASRRRFRRLSFSSRVSYPNT